MAMRKERWQEECSNLKLVSEQVLPALKGAGG